MPVLREKEPGLLDMTPRVQVPMEQGMMVGRAKEPGPNTQEVVDRMASGALAKA